MQITIGQTIAEVSDDGRDIQFPAPAVSGRVLTLPFQMSLATKPSAASTNVAAAIKSESPALMMQLQGPAGAFLLCAVMAAIAAKRFAGRTDAERTQAPSRLHEELDDATFLKRYGRTQ